MDAAAAAAAAATTSPTAHPHPHPHYEQPSTPSKHAANNDALVDGQNHNIFNAITNNKYYIPPPDQSHDHTKSTPDHHTHINEQQNDHNGVGTGPTPHNAQHQTDQHQGQDEVRPDHLESIHSPLPPDHGKVSQEIDHFISSLLLSEHDSPPPDLPSFVEQFMDLVEAKIERYDPSHGDALPRCHVKWSRLTPLDSASFLEAVNLVSPLSKALMKFHSEHEYASCINRLGRLLQRAMSYLEEEFKSLLEDHKACDSTDSSNNRNIHVDKPNLSSESSDHQNAPPAPAESESVSDQQQLHAEACQNIVLSGYTQEILSDLNRLSKALIAGGHQTECCLAYRVARRNALEEMLSKLGFEKHSIDDVHKMQWESLEREIEIWIRTLTQWETSHISSERKLSDTVFSDHPAISKSLFGSLSHGVTTQLFNFSEAVALTRRSVEKLFKFLDVYEALRDSLPEIVELMPEEWGVELKSEASLVRSSLGQAMILILNDLENSIKGDSGRTQVPGGAVHPLTKYTMNYLEYACEYKGTLDQIYNEHQKLERADSTCRSKYKCSSFGSNNEVEKKYSPFQVQITKVMDLLDENVEMKSKLYKDPALSSIFMMNNGRYILKKIQSSSELSSLMEETWYRKKSADVMQYHKVYQRETWGRLLGCFQSDGLVVNGKVLKPVLKERFKSFNAMFDEIHKTQSGWVVADELLQSELRVAISNMVIPAYRSYLGRYGHTFTPGRQTEKYIKYQPEDIETCIEDELFDGKK